MRALSVNLRDSIDGCIERMNASSLASSVTGRVSHTAPHKTTAYETLKLEEELICDANCALQVEMNKRNIKILFVIPR